MDTKIAPHLKVGVASLRRGHISNKNISYWRHPFVCGPEGAHMIVTSVAALGLRLGFLNVRCGHNRSCASPGDGTAMGEAGAVVG